MLNKLTIAVAIFVTLRTSFRAFSGPVNCVKDLMPADFHFRSSHWLDLSSIVSMTYTYCKKLLLNIELAVKIGFRLIERLPLLDPLQRWSEKAEGHDRSTDSRDTRDARTGKPRLNEAALVMLVSIELGPCPASLTKSLPRIFREQSKHSVHRSSLIRSGSAI